MQQGRWAHRLYLLKDRLQHQGMFPTLVIYYHRIRSMLFSRYTIGCVNRIEIGSHVLMGSKIYITDHNHGTYRGSHPDSPDVLPAKYKT